MKHEVFDLEVAWYNHLIWSLWMRYNLSKPNSKQIQKINQSLSVYTQPFVPIKISFALTIIKLLQREKYEKMKHKEDNCTEANSEREREMMMMKKKKFNVLVITIIMIHM